MAGSGRAAISLCSEAAHLFPGIGLPAPTRPQAGNSLALGLWEKGTHGSLPPQRAAAEAASRPQGSRWPAGFWAHEKGAGQRGSCPTSTTAQPLSSHNTLPSSGLTGIPGCLEGEVRG